MRLRGFRGRLGVCWLFLALVAPSWAGAQSATDEDASESWTSGDWYVGLGGVYSLQTRAEDSLRSLTASALPGSDLTLENSPGFASRLGRSWSDWLAAELQIEYLAGFDAQTQGVDVLTYRLLVMTGNLKLTAPLGRLRPYAVVGVGLANSWFDAAFDVFPDQSFASAAVRGGGGFDFFLMKDIAFSTQASYVFPTGDNEDLDYIALEFGLSYWF